MFLNFSFYSICMLSIIYRNYYENVLISILCMYFFSKVNFLNFTVKKALFSLFFPFFISIFPTFKRFLYFSENIIPYFVSCFTFIIFLSVLVSNYRKNVPYSLYTYTNKIDKNDLKFKKKIPEQQKLQLPTLIVFIILLA